MATIKTNFGGILAGIEEKTGLKISTRSLSRELPMTYIQARKLRNDEAQRFDATTLIKFIEFCKRFDITLTPNDIFKFETVKETS